MRSQKIKNLILAILVTVFCGVCVATAWATVTFVKPQDVTHQVEMAKKSEIPVQIAKEAKARAPEPSTIALFGSGIFGMFISFLRSQSLTSSQSLNSNRSLLH